MKTRLLLIICTIAVGINATAQNEPKEKNPIWKWVLEPQFENAQIFSEGLAAVRKDGKWGFINKNGEFVINPQFDGVLDFSDEYAAIKDKNKWGFIDKDGEIVIKARYVNARSFVDGIARVDRYEGDKDYYISKNNKEVISFKKQPKTRPATTTSRILFPSNQNKKFGFMDRNNKLVIQAQFENAKPFSEGLAAVKHDGKFGFITLISTSEYIKNYVNNEIVDSLKSGKNDSLKTVDYQQWVNMKVKELFDKAIVDYTNSPIFLLATTDTEISDYDSNNKTALVKTPSLGQFVFLIENESEVRMLKNSWNSVKITDVDFIFAYDNNTGEEKVIPASITIKYGRNSYKSGKHPHTDVIIDSFTEIDISRIVTAIDINNQ
jgi:KWG Leptospira.